MVVDFWILESNATKRMTWKFHIDESTNGRYNMILGRYLITTLVLDLKFFDNFIIGREGCSSTMVDVSNYGFKSIIDKTVKPEEYFINSYIDEDFESNNVIKSTRRMRRILDAKHEKYDLNEIMTKQF